jgi:pimeloyl-ACP methyl ester carboxylesterase
MERRGRKHLLAVSLAFALLIILAPPAQALDELGVFRDAPCPMPVPGDMVEGVDLTCGYVAVPEDHATPGDGTIQLAIAILHSTSAQPASDPLLMLQGGPGISALSTFGPLIASPFGDPFLEGRDVILLEQRGTYYAQPALVCSVEETPRECRDRLIAEGVSLQAYTIGNNAADVALVMEALGYDQYNLYGFSFGTRLAQIVMHDDPDGLRSVILDSTLSIALDEDLHGAVSEFAANSRLLTIRQLLADCAADRACSEFHPDLRAEIQDVIVAFNEQPALLTFEDPETDQPLEVTLSGDDLVGMLFDGLYEDMAEQLPAFLDLLAAGDLYLVFSADMFLPDESTWAEGLCYAMDCSGSPELLPAELDVEGLDAMVVHWQNEQLEDFNESCQVWGVKRREPYPILPAVSDLPTLLMSGELDPNAPPRSAQIVAENLSNGSVVVFPGLGHGVLDSHPCARSIALEFLDDPAVPPDTSCVTAIRSRFISEPIAVRLLVLQEDPPILRLVLLLGSLLLMLSGVVTWSLAAVRSRGQQAEQDKGANRAHWMAGAAVALNVVFLVILVASNPMDIIYGYPLLLRLGMLLPLLSMIPAVGALVYAGLAWKDGYWGFAGRVHYTLVTLATAVFLWQLNYWHLLGWRLF